MRARLPSSLAALMAAMLAPIWAQAQTVAPAAPAEAGAAPTIMRSVADEPVTVSVPDAAETAVAIEDVPSTLDTAPEEGASVEHMDVIVEGQLTSVRSRQIGDAPRLYDLTDIAKPLKSTVELHESLLGYRRFQDGALMSINMADGKVRSNKVVLGKLPGFEPRDVADTWIEMNAVAVMTGTHVSEDEQGRTVLTLDKQLKPQFGLELWVSGAPVDTFDNEPRTIGPVLLVPLEAVTQALGHQLTREGDIIRVRRTQDQAELQLELSTGIVSVNGVVRGVTPDMDFAERDTLILPFTAVETLTGTHIKLRPGSNRVTVSLDDRLSADVAPGGKVSDEARATPFTPEALSFQLGDRGPVSAQFTSRWGAYNMLSRVETSGGLADVTEAPAWISTDINSLDGWSATVGDYSAGYRELAGVGQSRIRGGSWRTQHDNGTILAVAAGVPLTGSEQVSEDVSVPTFGGFVGGARLIADDGDMDYGVSASISEDGNNGVVVAGGQKTYLFPENETGVQSVYVAGDIAAFSGDVSGADVRARGAVNYAVSDQLGLSASASYDGAQFNSGAARANFSGVFDQSIGARTNVTGNAYWRAYEPWGVLRNPAVSARVSIDTEGGDTDSTDVNFGAAFNTQVGDNGPSISVNLAQTQSDKAGIETTSSNLRIRALQNSKYVTLTATYATGEQTGEARSEQFVLSAYAKPLRKDFDHGAYVAITPTATAMWNGESTDLNIGATVFAESGNAFGDKFGLKGRFSALSQTAADVSATRFIGNVDASYRVTRNLSLSAGYSDDFEGNRDLSVALRGVVTFNEPRRHTLPDDGRGILTGRVFLDKNRDGIRQDDEIGVSGVRVMLRGTRLALNSARDGFFTVQNVQQGLYTVTIDRRTLPLGYMVSEAAEPRVTVGDGRRSDVDVPLILSGQVRGAVFVDENANGATDAGETRLEGQWVKLIPVNGGEARRAQSASFGQFSFENVNPGEYRLEVTVSGVPIVQSVTVSDDNPFVRQPVAVPPDVPATGGGLDFSGDVMGEA